jgi:hypothetical protein
MGTVSGGNRAFERWAHAPIAARICPGLTRPLQATRGGPCFRPGAGSALPPRAPERQNVRPATPLNPFAAMRLLVVVSIIVLTGCSSGERFSRVDAEVERSADALSACLRYRGTVELHGTLRREVFPGPPNFESIADGDEPQAGFYLHLADAVCAQPSTEEAEAPTEPALQGVTHVQLVLDSAGYERLRPQLDQEVTIRGSLFSSHTGHHHAPLLLQARW